MAELDEIVLIDGKPDPATVDGSTVPTLAPVRDAIIAHTDLTETLWGTAPLDALAAGAGNVSSSTLRTVAAADQPPIQVKSGGDEYETVAAGQTAQVLGATGAIGDYLETLICVVSTSATSQVQIKDGSGSNMLILPNDAGIGTHVIPIGLPCVDAGWKITTAAGVSVIATGRFT